MSSASFSVDEIVDSLWPTAAPERAEAAAATPMSDWDYESLFQEVSSTSADCGAIVPPPPSGSQSELLGKRNLDQAAAHPPISSDDYHAYLKSQLHRACAAVAVARSGVPAAKPNNQPQPSKSVARPSSESRGIDSGPAASKVQCASDGAPLHIPAAPHTTRKSDVQVKPSTSESSGEDSDDDELEVDTGTTENQDPADVKRVRRMKSNRESARRSRRRKQEHMNELETQVGQLKVEHTTLLKRLTDVNQKYDEASVDNRIMKADIETLRAKVKMAEETVKRATGINPLLLAMSSMPNTSIPFMSTTMDSFPIHPMPTQHNPSHDLFNLAPNIGMPNSHPPRLDSAFQNHTSSNLLPTAVGNLQNGGVNNNAPHIPSVPSIDGSMPVWTPDLPHSKH